MPDECPRFYGPIGQQQGAGLLAFMLVLLVGVSYALLRDINAVTRSHRYGTATTQALQEARIALIGWAINHPVNPGTLPMPDRKESVNPNYDGDSDCYNGGPVGNNLLLGKLPWKDYPSPCIDASTVGGLRISASDTSDTSNSNKLNRSANLWYAVSVNLVYQTPDYPEISPALLDSNSGWITVRDRNGEVLDSDNDGIPDRVAFIIIDPGTALPGQDRNTSVPAVTEFLDEVTIDGATYSNADYDQDFIIYPDSDRTDDTGDSFNDRLVFVTIEELMQGVGRRVLNEVGAMLSEYQDDVGALPWLSPYTDARAAIPVIRGEVMASGSTTLVNFNADFVAAGIESGDIVLNTTDGSFAEVTNPVSQTSLTVTGLSHGVENDFDDEDEYYIVPQSAAYLTDSLSGTATAGSAGLVLEDTDKNFIRMGIKAGDVLENAMDGSSRIIAEVSTSGLRARKMDDLDTGDFDASDSYRIRSNMGTATAGSTDLILEDTNRNFVSLGINPGEVVENLTDGSFGQITDVTTTTLTVVQLSGGKDNRFTMGDLYRIPRFNAVENTRQGLLAFHQPGMVFATSMDLEWDIVVDSGDVNFDSTTFPDVDDYYADTLTSQLENFAAVGSRTFETEENFCRWSVPEVAECHSGFIENLNIDGTVTDGVDTTILTDSSADFVSDGVKRGDVVQNYDDELAAGISGTADSGSSGSILYDAATNFNSIKPYQYLIHNTTTGIRALITELIDEHTIGTKEFPNQPSAISFAAGQGFTIYTPAVAVVTNDPVSNPQVLNTTRATSYNPDFDDNAPYPEYYRIVSATKISEGQALNSTPSSTTLIDTGANFVSTGIVEGDIVENETDGSFGRITSVSATSLSATPYGGSDNQYAALDAYRIYHHYAYSRRYEFHTVFRQEQVETVTGVDTGRRTRSVCRGYAADCVSPGIPVSLDADGELSFITLRDYAADGATEVGRASYTPSVATDGSILAKGMDYYLAELSDELPGWFIRNKWYQYIYVAYSAGESPGASSVCTAGSDCLVLDIIDPDTDTAIAGIGRDDIRAMLVYTGSELSGQSQASGKIEDYLDDADNVDQDDNFEKNEKSAASNDLFRLATSCPAPNGDQLCWTR